MSAYDVYIQVEAVKVMKTIRGIDRSLLTDFIDGVSHNPDLPGDYVETDDTGRNIQF